MKVSVSFPSSVLLIFTTLMFLKVTNHIDLSWVWVFSPLWLPFAIFGIFLTTIFLIATVKQIKTGDVFLKKDKTKPSKGF